MPLTWLAWGLLLLFLLLLGFTTTVTWTAHVTLLARCCVFRLLAKGFARGGFVIKALGTRQRRQCFANHALETTQLMLVL